jgi:hypothetical protein
VTGSVPEPAEPCDSVCRNLGCTDACALPVPRDVHAPDFPYVMTGDTPEQVEAKIRHAHPPVPSPTEPKENPVPRADDHRFTRVTLWIEQHDTGRLMEAIADDLVPSVRVVRVVRDQQLPAEDESRG